tara:strand:- start:54 stop:557 length:504 start_codon:yes stop_codon:yes gene_type:complete
MEDREIVIAKVNEYIDWLGTPNEAFGGFPICPFVEKERASGKLKYEIFKIGFTKPLFDLIEKWDDEDDYNSMIIAYLSDIKMSEYKTFQHWLNRELRQRSMGYVKAICFHPDDTFEVDGIATRSKAPYFLLNIAYIDELNKAHQHLKATKYFDKFTEESKKYLKTEV